MWTVETLDKAVDAEIEALPKDQRAKLDWIVRLIEEHGLERVKEPYVKHLQDKLWEMRMKGKDGISRALYVTATGKRIVILRAFVKKTQKTPRKEIKLALERAEKLT